MAPLPRPGAPGSQPAHSMNCSPCGCRSFHQLSERTRVTSSSALPHHLAHTSIKTLIPLCGSYSCIGLFPRNSGSVPEGRSWFLVILAAPARFCVGEGCSCLSGQLACGVRWGTQPTSRPSCVFSSPSRRGIKGKFDALHPEWRPAGGTNKSLGFNDRTAESELQELSTAD